MLVPGAPVCHLLFPAPHRNDGRWHNAEIWKAFITQQILPFSGNSGLAPLWPLHGPPWRASRSFWNVFAIRVCCMHSVVSFSLHSSVPGGGSPWHGPSQPYLSPLFYLGPCSNSPGFGEAFRLLWCLIVMKHYLKLKVTIFFFSIWRGLSNQLTDIIGDWTLVIEVVEKVFTNLLFPGTNIWKVGLGQTHTTLRPGHDLKGNDIFDQWILNKSLFCKNTFSFPITITLPCNSMKSDNKWWVWMHFIF